MRETSKELYLTLIYFAHHPVFNILCKKLCKILCKKSAIQYMLVRFYEMLHSSIFNYG